MTRKDAPNVTPGDRAATFLPMDGTSTQSSVVQQKPPLASWMMTVAHIGSPMAPPEAVIDTSSVAPVQPSTPDAVYVNVSPSGWHTTSSLMSLKQPAGGRASAIPKGPNVPGGSVTKFSTRDPSRFARRIVPRMKSVQYIWA